MLELKSKNGDKMVESNDDIEFSERDLALIEALRKVKKKKRRKFILLLIFVTMIIGSVSIYVIEHPRELLFLKSENVTVELGNDVLVKPQGYLDKDKTDEDAYKNAQLTASILKQVDNYTIVDNKTIISKGKNYLDVGKYSFEISYLSQSKKVNINVVDTVKPVFEVFNTQVEVEAETKEIKWADYYQASDLTDVQIKVDDSEVDLNKAGTYKITVTATDANGNFISKNAKVKVKEKPKPEPTPTPAPAQNTTPNYNNSSSNNAPAQPAAPAVPAAPAPDTSHGTEYFMFDSGYDFDSAYGACVSAMNSHGSGSCTPTTDAEGTYTGYVLNY